MRVEKKIRVLIVDDSMVFRETIAKGISFDPVIEVVGRASNPYEAKDMILELKPDVMTLDIEMPRMNGIEFLKKLMPQYPISTVVVSSISNFVFDAMDAGAVDFVTKPDMGLGRGLDSFINELVIKIKIASTANVSHWKLAKTHKVDSVASNLKISDSVIAIGASTGGTEAIFSILKALPLKMPGIVIVQHMPPVFTKMYAERLNQNTVFGAKEAENGDEIKPGSVLVAPGDYQMKMIKRGRKYMVECFKGDKVNGHRPSVDVLFNSVAEVMGSRAIGVILTGMGYDGAKGILEMKKKGAITIGQDEKSCVVYGMPRVAYDIGAVTKQIPLSSIPSVICRFVNKNEEYE
jgi:two-component system, chemotaxis family, protein-glutamate methylesterase/glutaminase